MYPIPPTEKLVETRQCRHCQADFPITDKDLEFYDKVSPKFGDVKYNIPAPTLCPDCRQQRRLTWRNERKLYKRKCDATGKEIISNYSPDKPFRIFNQEYWWGDQWDAMDYGKPYDFARPFFQQFGELIAEVPFSSILLINSENCGYSHIISNSKNLYLCYDGDNGQDSLYCYWFGNLENCVDVRWSIGIRNSYDLVNCLDCDSCLFCSDLSNCGNCYFSDHLDGCHNCLFCSNLRNRNYCIGNISVSAEEFKKTLHELRTGSFQKDERTQCFVPAQRIRNSEFVTGNGIANSKNVGFGFDVKNVSDVKYAFDGWDTTNCMDIYEFIASTEWSYESASVESGKKVIACYDCFKVSDSFYCLNCHDSSHTFGCIGLRNKKYCVFNKQYAREEYEDLVPRIIEHMKATGEWGEFFPSVLSPFGYNETVAQEHYPLDKATATRDQIFNWSDYEVPFPKVEKIIPASKLPDDIAQIPDDILNWAVECEVTGKPFRIIKQELEFYRKHWLPIPRIHPDQRHLDRMALRNPRKLYERDCDKCGKKMITTYAPERPETVYCKECYNQEVI